jgi:drug/metabolite transporter (DMT)-like permease
LLWLPAVILLSFGFGQLFKWSQRRGCCAPIVVSVNYLVLAASLALYYGLRGELFFTPPILMVGAVTGATFIVSMFAMTRALEIADVGAVLTSFRLAILLPIGAAVWLWNETATASQFAGILLALISLVLMTWGKNGSSKDSSSHLLLIFLVFILQGLSQICIHWVHHAGLDAQRQLVLLVTALTAGLLGSLSIVAKGQRPTGKDLTMGAGIGLFNLVALIAILTALSKVQGTIYFPLQGCAVVIMDNLFAHFIWKESLSHSALVGAGLGALSMLLIL